MFLSHNTFFYFKIHIKNLFDLKSKVVAKGNKVETCLHSVEILIKSS